MPGPEPIVERYIRPSKRELEIDLAMQGKWKLSEFHHVRNQLLKLFRRFGTVGPMGEFSTEGDCPYLERNDPNRGPTARKPDYFVVDGQYSAHRYQRVEAKANKLVPGLLRGLTALLRQTNGWIVYLALTQGGLVVSADRIGYEGELFEGCENISDLELRCAPVQ